MRGGFFLHCNPGGRAGRAAGPPQAWSLEKVGGPQRDQAGDFVRTRSPPGSGVSLQGWCEVLGQPSWLPAVAVRKAGRAGAPYPDSLRRRSGSGMDSAIVSFARQVSSEDPCVASVVRVTTLAFASGGITFSVVAEKRALRAAVH